MTNDVDFDALARKTAESDGTMGDLNNLWGAVFALSEWHFIARGTLPSVRPYIASNAEYADGKQMVRAFTDTARLQRFARENNLTEADGSAQILSLPTAKIIDYLEQFIPYGVHGIWFNSDTASDGFFLPLAQLRPVKEYLAKMNWQPSAAPEPVAAPVFEPPAEPAAAPVSDQASAPQIEAFHEPTAPPATAAAPLETLVVTVRDGLALPSGFISQASYACNFFCRVPAGWIRNGTLQADFLEKVYEQVYGANWRLGNDDGSRYVVIDSSVKIFTPDELRAAKWGDTANTADNHFWFYIADESGELKNVKAEEFQAAVDAAPPPTAAVTANATNEPDAPAAQAVSELPALRRGEVSFDTTIEAFQTRLAGLFEDYQSAEDFGDIFALAPAEMEGLVEKTFSNPHGAFLRGRHFFYQPDAGTMVSVSTLDSRALRAAGTTDEPLRASFALLKYLVNQTALLYFKFEGTDAEVRKLSAAFEPLLDACGFKESA